MKIDAKIAVALIAGFALYHLLGPCWESAKGLLDWLVFSDLAFRVVRLGGSRVSEIK